MDLDPEVLLAILEKMRKYRNTDITVNPLYLASIIFSFFFALTVLASF